MTPICIRTSISSSTLLRKVEGCPNLHIDDDSLTLALAKPRAHVSERHDVHRDFLVPHAPARASAREPVRARQHDAFRGDAGRRHALGENLDALASEARF